MLNAPFLLRRVQVAGAATRCHPAVIDLADSDPFARLQTTFRPVVSDRRILLKELTAQPLLQNAFGDRSRRADALAGVERRMKFGCGASRRGLCSGGSGGVNAPPPLLSAPPAAFQFLPVLGRRAAAAVTLTSLFVAFVSFAYLGCLLLDIWCDLRMFLIDQRGSFFILRFFCIFYVLHFIVCGSIILTLHFPCG